MKLYFEGYTLLTLPSHKICIQTPRWVPLHGSLTAAIESSGSVHPMLDLIGHLAPTGAEIEKYAAEIAFG